MKIGQLPAVRVLVIVLSCILSFQFLGIRFSCIWFTSFLLILYILNKDLKAVVIIFFLGVICFLRLSIDSSVELPKNCFKVSKILKSNLNKSVFIAEGVFKCAFTFNRLSVQDGNYMEGDIIENVTNFKSLPNPKSLKGFIYADYLKGLGVDSIVYSRKPFKLIFRDSFNLSFWATKIRWFVIDYLNDFNVIKHSTRGFTIAILTGDKSYLSFEDKKLFRDTGIVHVLAISGLHVGIFYLTLSFLFFKLFRLPPKLGFFIILSLLIGYAFITALSPSVVRSVIMFGLIQFGNSFRKRPNTLNIIFASAVLMLFYEPDLIVDIGFQLSYAAVIGIVLVIKHTELSGLVKFKFLRWVWELFLVSTSAFVFTTPILSFHFGIINMTGLWASMIIIPFITLIMYSAFLVLMLFFHKSSAEFIFSFLEGILSFVTTVLKVLVDFFSVNFWSFISFSEMIVAYLVIMSLILKNLKILYFLPAFLLLHFLFPIEKKLRLLMRGEILELRMENDRYEIKKGERLIIKKIEINYKEKNSVDLIGLNSIEIIDFNVNKYQLVILDF